MSSPDLLMFLKLYLQDHIIITAPEESEDYQALLNMLENITEQTVETLQEQVDVWTAKKANDGIIGCYLKGICTPILEIKHIGSVGMFPYLEDNQLRNQNTGPNGPSEIKNNKI